MKWLLLSIFSILVLSACKNNSDITKNQNIKGSSIVVNPPSHAVTKMDATSVGDTLVVTKASVIYYVADSATLMKKINKRGEDYYRAADDYNFYGYQLDSVTDKKNLIVINTEKKNIKFIQPNGESQNIDLSKELWATYFFKPGSKPKVVDMASPVSEYKKYFATNI